MKDFYDFGTTPFDEDCVQVSSKVEYMTRMRDEASRMLAICKKLWPSLFWSIQSNPHDFGSYLTLRCYYDDENEEQTKAFYDADNNWPSTWNEAYLRVASLGNT